MKISYISLRKKLKEYSDNKKKKQEENKAKKVAELMMIQSL